MKQYLKGLLLASLFTATPLLAADYDVTITNVTRGTVFTPIYVVSQTASLNLFELGQPASDELAALAEGGDFSLLEAAIGDDPRVVATANSGGPLLPGDSVTVRVKAARHHGRISVLSMMLPTNDGFIALKDVRTPGYYRSASYNSPGYDAGSEPNDELCDHIPGGGNCAGAGGSPGVGGEGYVHIHAGIHGIGDLDADAHDWRNPAAHITIKRVRSNNGHHGS